MPTEVNFQRALDVLRSHGILLESDSQLPSVATLVAGRSIHGSWWAHPRGREIHQISQRLTHHPEVTVAKLVSKKITFIHSRLRPALLAVASKPQPWQLKGLSSTAKSLLVLVMRAGEMRTDQIPTKANIRRRAIGDAARELETRLLVHSVEIHTQSGAHAKQLESWKAWAKRAGVSGRKMPYELAKKELESVLAALNQQYGASGKLPWH